MAAPALGCPVSYTGREPIAAGTGSDCDDTDGDRREAYPCYTDADGDGWGTGAPTYECPDACVPGRATLSGDCCDTSANARPGQTGYFATMRPGCGGFDYDCDGVESGRFPRVTRFCTPSSEMCRVANPGYRSAEPACGLSGIFVESCIWGPPGSCNDTTTSQQQTCR